MRCLLMFVAAAVTGGFAIGEEPSQVPEELKGFRPILGTWRYDGPLLEDVPGLAEKGSNYVVEVTFRFILDKQAAMDDWTVEYAGGKKVYFKGLTGWNAGEKRLVRGDMSSIGSMSLGSIVFEDNGRVNTLTCKGIDSEGNEISFKGTIRKTGKDTMTWQAVERTGGDVEGPSPVYEFKRVKRTKGKKAD